ncbi:MAG: hypothetical protein AAF724_21280 [Pseudomonadota bacterium]
MSRYSDLSITGSTLNYNYGYGGGAVGSTFLSSDGTFELIDSELYGNTSQNGSMLNLQSFDNVTISRSSLTNSYSYYAYDPVVVVDEADVSITDSTFSGNDLGPGSFGSSGALLTSYASDLDIVNTTFADNERVDNILRLYGGTATLDQVTITANLVDTSGSGTNDGSVIYAGEDGGTDVELLVFDSLKRHSTR